jgi:hypothetical protein
MNPSRTSPVCAGRTGRASGSPAGTRHRATRRGRKRCRRSRPRARSSTLRRH